MKKNHKTKNKISKNPLILGYYITLSLKKYALTSIISVIIANGLSRFTAVILKNLTDSLTTNPIDIHSITFWALSYPVLFFIEEILWRISGFTGMYWFMNFRYIATNSLYKYLTHHSKNYFNNRFAGTLTNKIGNAVDGIENLFENILWQFGPLAMGILWYTIFAFSSNYRLGLIIFLWSILFFVVNLIFAKKLQPISVKNAKADSTLKGRIVDSLSNISLVHEYAYITGEHEYIKKYIKKSRDIGISHWKLAELMLSANAALIFIFICFMIGTSIFLFRENIVSAGVIVMAIIITLDLSRQLIFLGQQIRTAARLYGEAKEGLVEILQGHLIKDSSDATVLKISKSEIDFNTIDFQYDNDKIFNNFSLHIPSGQKIGLVGKSGAGKSTFVTLLLRHYDVQKGEIKIDNQNISKVTLESLRSAISFVPQDTSLFHRTIKENISYSNPNASSKDIIQAAKLAHADDFINQLKDGYETLVGERGVKLSGGQRQRIALARAFLKNTPILILDEATSSLDSESENIIQESLEKLIKGKTVIAVAHRLSTLKKMDRIVVIDNGKIIEDGNPNELLKNQNGLFKNLWDHQVKGFIPDE